MRFLNMLSFNKIHRKNKKVELPDVYSKIDLFSDSDELTFI